MPTYEYICPNCEHEFEVFQSFSEKPIKTCPECKGRKVEKLISGGAGVVFKGSGFYETDYNRGEGSDYKKKVDAEKPVKGSKKDASKKDSSTKKPNTKTSKKD